MHRDRSRADLLGDLVSERDAFPVIFRKPPFGRVFVGEDLEMVDVAELLAGVDVDQINVSADIIEARSVGSHEQSTPV
jgi:hypothetical protein